MKSTWLPIGIFALTACVIGLYPLIDTNGATTDGTTVNVDPPVDVVAPATPRIEVVFVLDTTSSMSGLIQAAKDNIWSIASTMASAQPAPKIEMGLVAFRDRGDAYVTKVFDLSDDLDSMYATLMDFKAVGGGDGPESVNQALHDAVNDISWSQDPNSYQVIFLVGDAPPHMDYNNDVRYPETVKRALEKGIVINTIQAGSNPNTQAQWQRIAKLSQGDFFSVGQSGSAIALDTPFDEKIAALSEELDKTRFFYGSEQDKVKQEAKVAASEKLHALASVASRARRALFNASAAGAKNLLGDKELVSDIADGRVELGDVAESELPAALRAMAPQERKAEVQKRAERREDLNEQIAKLNKKRQGYLQAEIGASDDGDESLDYKIYETVSAQAKEKGLHYDSSPKY